MLVKDIIDFLNSYAPLDYTEGFDNTGLILGNKNDKVNGIIICLDEFFILFIGVMVFVFYQFNPSPINFNPQGEEVIFNTVYQNEYIELKESLEDNFKEKTLVVNEFLISESQELKDKINNLSEQEQYLRDRAKILIVKAAELKKQKIVNDHNNGTEDTSPTFKAFDEGSTVMSKESNSQLALRQEKFIRDLKTALIRIENKTYGICRVTGKLISKKRLMLVPHATLSIEAKNMQK